MATQVGSGPPASARPTGTVTFLFSDIEGSTVRWDANPEAMASALARHDAVMRATLEERGGHIFKTMGDAFCVAFATAPDAFIAALEVQRAVAAEDFSAVDDLRVRIALHTGATDERDGDYFGPTVNRVARLLAIGHGGQVLVSGIAADLVQSEMPPESSLRDLGNHRLKDLAHPEHVFQLVTPDLPEAFPALNSLNYLANNLPAQLTSFVGREDVIADIKALLKQHRLVTLVGTGGAGKTRCAIQVGAELVDGSGNGVWLAELAPIADPSLVASVVARALNVQESPNKPILDTLLAYLKRKRLLLIFDNCEHVIEEARRVVGAILRDCPEAHILVTSREPLNISGEQTYRMPSLAVPSNDRFSTEEASRFGALQLFVDRALSSDKSFALTTENAPHVSEICRRLDGIPLAIELAAARVKMLSPQQLAQKLDERFRVLTGGDRSALPRQQTMRALIDWSYDLLSDDERVLFRKLSIFAGGFTLESASAVCSDEMIDELAVFDLLSSLVDKSLVQAEPAGSGTRYRLLESTRQYAREKLADVGEADTVARAHAGAFAVLAEQLDDTYETTPDRAWFAQAEPELENLRAALLWAFGTHGDVLIGQRLACALRRQWAYIAAAEGRRWIQRAQERADDTTPHAVLAALDLAEASLATAVTQHKASLAAAERALARYRELADPLWITEAKVRVGRGLLFVGRITEGEALLREALSDARGLGARKLANWALGGLAFAREFAKDVDEARLFYGEALASARAAGAERQGATMALSLAETEFCAGDTAAALRLAEEALPVWRGLHATLFVANLLCNTAAYLVALRRFDEARASAREALAAARDAQWAVGLAWTLQHLAALGTLQQRTDVHRPNDDVRATRLLGYVDARLEMLEAPREYTERQEYDKIFQVLSDALGADECAKLMAEGSTWSEDQAVAEAMLI
jgi:predicted ATPase/class 3 adenylate cyclase